MESSSALKPDPKRRMSLKGPPLRVAVKEKPQQPTPVQAAPRPSIAPVSTSIDRRQSLSVRAIAKQAAPRPVAQKETIVKEPQSTAENPITMILSRLDAIERRVSDLQTVVGRIAVLEELVRPLKPILNQNALEISHLQQNVLKLNEATERHEKKILKYSERQESRSRRESQAFEEVRSGCATSFPISTEQAFQTLDVSLKNGDISIDEYTSSFQLPIESFASTTLNNDIFAAPVQHSHPASIIPIHVPDHVTNTNDKNSVIQPTFLAQKEQPLVESGTFLQSSLAAPVTNQQTSLLPSASQETTSQGPSATNEIPVLKELNSNILQSTNIQTRRKTKDSSVDSDFNPGDSMFTMMTPISKEEKGNVSLWLGVEFHELNRAIDVMNEHANNQRFDMTTLTEVFITEEDIAAQCKVEAKKAKAIVLLLCKLKRLQLRREKDAKMYRLLAGTTLEAQ